MPAKVKPALLSWPQLFKRTWHEANEDDLFGRSAQLAYYFFLAIFPMLICVFAVRSLFPAAAAHVRHAVLTMMSGMLPGTASQLMRQTLAEINRSHADSRISFGLIFSLWSASAGMSALMDTLNAEYEVKETRPFIKKNVIAVGLTIVTGMLVVGAIALVVAGGKTADTFSHGTITVLLKIVEWPVAIVLLLLAFAIIYFLAPDVKEQKWHWVTPGAISALTLWLIVSIGLKIYLHFFNRYGMTYGSLGAVIILLLWFYLTGAAVLIGAEMNSVLEDAAAEVGAPDAKMKPSDMAAQESSD